jgi:hypothetical protein
VDLVSVSPDILSAESELMLDFIFKDSDSLFLSSFFSNFDFLQRKDAALDSISTHFVSLLVCLTPISTNH